MALFGEISLNCVFKDAIGIVLIDILHKFNCCKSRLSQHEFSISEHQKYFFQNTKY